MAKVHALIVLNSCLDLGCHKPRAPQCERYFTTFAISKVRALAKSEGSCLAVAEVAQPPLVQPQRLLPRRVYRLGVFSAHEFHTLVHFCGRLW